MGFEAGSVLAGRYRISRVLGKGAFGVVIAADDDRLRRTVAIKMVAPEVTADMDRSRLLREARAAARLRSPHVVQIHDVDTLDDGSAYIVMELCEGHDLETELALRPGMLPVEEVCAWMSDVCLALAEAHAAGIVHRDLKPANILLAKTATGRTAKVGDFGVSKLSATDDTQTAGGAIVGTPRYMSPEQLRGEVVDTRSDIWAVGVILYRLLTGKHPFDGPNTSALALSIAKIAPVPLMSVRPELPPELVAIIDQALSKNREARPARAEEIAEVLRRFAGTLDTTRSRKSVTDETAASTEAPGEPTRDLVAIGGEPTESPPGVLLESVATKPRRTAPLVLGIAAFVVVGVIVAVTVRGRGPTGSVTGPPAPPPSTEPAIDRLPPASSSAAITEPSTTASASASPNKQGPRKRLPAAATVSATSAPTPSTPSTDVPLHL